MPASEQLQSIIEIIQLIYRKEDIINGYIIGKYNLQGIIIDINKKQGKDIIIMEKNEL